MSSEAALRVVGLSKSYRIHHEERQATLAEQALHRIRNPFLRPSAEVFWALKDVDLEVAPGEVFGVIGHNGAGKSTLLKVLSRITPPTAGRIEVRGRIGSLLEVGTGFHPELTGRENIYLNGSILGMRTTEINQQFDEIVEFAGVERFLDTPVKRYSSGMYVRLAFAVAAHLNTEILLVDEVLAVGDAAFQARSLAKIARITEAGRTVVFVSHNLDAVARTCSRAALLRSGTVYAVGTPADVVHAYSIMLDDDRVESSATRRTGSGEFRVVNASTVGGPFGSADRKCFRFTVRHSEGTADRYFLSAVVYDDQRRAVAHCDSRLSAFWIHHTDDERTFDLVLRSPWLIPGRYTVDLFICNAGVIDHCERAIRFDVINRHPYDCPVGGEATSQNLVLPDFAYSDVEVEHDAASLSMQPIYTAPTGE